MTRAALAAHEFGRRRRMPRRPARLPWRALALRWRRAPRRRTVVAVLRPRPAVFSTWLTQIQLRFGALVAAAPSIRRAAEGQAALATKTGVQSTPRPKGRWVPAWRMPRIERHSAPPHFSSHDHRSHLATRAVHTLSESTYGFSTRITHAQLRRGARAGSSQATVLLPIRTRAHSPASTAGPNTIGGRHTQPAIERVAVHYREVDRRMRVRQVVNPVTLVWRKPSDATDAGARELPPRDTSVRAVDTAAEGSVQRSAPAPAVMKTYAAAALLEPALVERLADDVMRRVERRARIERERRGL